MACEHTPHSSRNAQDRTSSHNSDQFTDQTNRPSALPVVSRVDDYQASLGRCGAENILLGYCPKDLCLFPDTSFTRIRKDSAIRSPRHTMSLSENFGCAARLTGCRWCFAICTGVWYKSQVFTCSVSGLSGDPHAYIPYHSHFPCTVRSCLSVQNVLFSYAVVQS